MYVIHNNINTFLFLHFFPVFKFWYCVQSPLDVQWKISVLKQKPLRNNTHFMCIYSFNTVYSRLSIQFLYQIEKCFFVFLGFFVPGFPKLMRFQEHHDRILQKMMPKLKQHLVRQRKKHLQNMYYIQNVTLWATSLINALCPILTFHNGRKPSYAVLFLAYIVFSICQCIGAFSEVNPGSWPTLRAHVTENSQRNANGDSLKGRVINKRQY